MPCAWRTTAKAGMPASTRSVPLIGGGRLMLEASAAEYVQRRLHVALGDLDNLAGGVSFDVGLVGSARVHFAEAPALAGWGRNNSLVANICYRLGRVCLHHESLDEALDYFELGLLAATGPGDGIAASILSVNSAWTHARKGDGDQALAGLNRGRGHFAAADHTDVPAWARFFTEADLSAVIGAVHTDLALTVNAHHTRDAIPLLTEAVDGYGDDWGPQPRVQPHPAVDQPPDRQGSRSRRRHRIPGAGIRRTADLGARP
jgi:hypothetical protein